MAEKHVNTGEALRFGWNTFKEHAGFLVLMMLVSMIIIFVPYGLSLAVMERSTILGMLCLLVYYVVTFVISMGYLTIALKLVDGQKPEMNDLWKHTDGLLRFVGGTLLYGLIVGVGFVLLIVPGVIWALKYYFVPYLLIDKKMKPMDALRMSGEMTNGIKLDLFGFLIIVGLVAMVGYLLLFVGLFVTAPVAMLAVAFTYRAIEKQMHGGMSQPTAPAASTPSAEVMK
jgi:uncharacterized membrane protein